MTMSLGVLLVCLCTISFVHSAPYLYPRYFNPRDYWAYWNFRGPFVDSAYEPRDNYLYGYGYDYTVYNDARRPPPRYQQPDTQYESKLRYFGKFEDSCEDKDDGLYYVDARSFAFCTSGQLTLQPCAEGAANPPLDHFTSGRYYGFNDFCSVNLLAKGYRSRAESVTSNEVSTRRSPPRIHVFRDHREYVYMPHKESSYEDRSYEYGPTVESAEYGPSAKSREYGPAKDGKTRGYEEPVEDQSFYRSQQEERRYYGENNVVNREKGGRREELGMGSTGMEHEFEKHYIVEDMRKDRKKYKQ